MVLFLYQWLSYVCAHLRVDPVSVGNCRYFTLSIGLINHPLWSCLLICQAHWRIVHRDSFKQSCLYFGHCLGARCRDILPFIFVGIAEKITIKGSPFLQKISNRPLSRAGWSHGDCLFLTLQANCRYRGITVRLPVRGSMFAIGWHVWALKPSTLVKVRVKTFWWVSFASLARNICNAGYL